MAKLFSPKSTSNFRTLSHCREKKPCQESQSAKKPPCPTAKISLLLALPWPSPSKRGHQKWQAGQPLSIWKQASLFLVPERDRSLLLLSSPVLRGKNEALNKAENAMDYLDTHLLSCRHGLYQMVLETLSSPWFWESLSPEKAVCV